MDLFELVLKFSKKILLLLRFTFVENDRHKIVSNALIYIQSVMGSLCFC